MKEEKKRGFAKMTKERHQAIASEGGKTAHAMGLAYEWTPEEARAAGRKGGKIISRDRERMSRIGKLGGAVRARQRKAEVEARRKAEEENKK